VTVPETYKDECEIYEINLDNVCFISFFVSKGMTTYFIIFDKKVSILVLDTAAF